MTGRSVGTEDGLLSYRPDLPVPPDFDGFWADTLAMSRAAARPAVLASVDTPVTELDLFDLTFTGFAGEPIRAWVAAPRGATAAPAVVEYRGYSFGRGVPGERVHWAVCGYVHVVMDNRGQGACWAMARTPPTRTARGRPRRIRDARAGGIRASTSIGGSSPTPLCSSTRNSRLPFVDAARVAVTGISQGGGGGRRRRARRGQRRGRDARRALPLRHPGSLQYATAQPMLDLVHYLSVHRANAAQALETLSLPRHRHQRVPWPPRPLLGRGSTSGRCPATVSPPRSIGTGARIANSPSTRTTGTRRYGVPLAPATWLAPRLAVDALPT
ncbi:MAG: acetylxylan esterase [Schumannella sp.]